MDISKLREFINECKTDYGRMPNKKMNIYKMIESNVSKYLYSLELLCDELEKNQEGNVK